MTVVRLAVIPVPISLSSQCPDTGIQFLLPGVKLSFLDSSVKHWNDIIGATRMTKEGSVTRCPVHLVTNIKKFTKRKKRQKKP
ncbi:hypothetical protein [Wolbachia endosymbiont (group B) of Limnophora tigrina]|uniref:hypothetical protein n=1 Tax=Wolbachia endosymbiont (group B) of Limnophora tigrina TaxID=3139317 RepID=UPI0035B5104A